MLMINGVERTVGGTMYGTIMGQVRGERVEVADAARTNSALTNDYIVAFTSLSAGRTYTISTADIAQKGRVIIVKDESGVAGVYNITIATQASEKIDGQATLVISQNYGFVTLESNGSHLFSVS